MKSLQRLKLVGVFLALATILATACFEIISPDFFWHLKMGEDAVTRHLSPFIDHYSFTYPGVKIKSIPWPFQIIIYTFYSFAGYFGIAILRFLIWLSSLLLIFRIFRIQKIAEAIQVVAILFFLLITAFRSEPRPELLSLPLELWTILLCYQWRSDHFRHMRPTLILAGTLFLWSNLHVTSIFGFVIVGGFLFEQMVRIVLEKQERIHLKHFILSALTMILVGFLNHDLTHPLLSPLSFSPGWATYITEFAARPFSSQELYLQIFWILTVLTLPGLILQGEIAGLIIIVVMSVKTWSMSKVFPHHLMMTIPFICQGLNYYFNALTRHKQLMTRKALVASLIALSLILVWQLTEVVMVHPIHSFKFGINPDFYPVDSVEFMKDKGMKGRILAEYGSAGYVIEFLSPALTVYIDPRTHIIYPFEFMVHYMTLLTSPDILIEDTKKYEINWVLGTLEKPGELVDTALNSGLFGISYVGRNSMLLGTNSNQYPVSTMSFIHPECLESTPPQKIAIEFQTARQNLPGNSPLVAFLSLANDYFNGAQNSVQLNSPSSTLTKNSYTTRLAAVLARTEKKGAAALFFYSHIRNPSQDDRIDWAEADCEFNLCTNSEVILDSMRATGLRADHIFRAYKILVKLKAEGRLKIFTEERLSRNKVKIEKYLDSGKDPHRPDWCDTKIWPR